MWRFHFQQFAGTPGIAVVGRIGRCAVVGGVLLLNAVVLVGCSVREDPHYNLYAPHNDRKTLLEHTDEASNRIDQALDNLDTRFENAVY